MPVSCWARTAAVKITISLSAAQLRYVCVTLLVLPSAHCSVLRWLCTEPVLMRLAPCSSQRVSVLTVLTVSAFPREAGVRGAEHPDWSVPGSELPSPAPVSGPRPTQCPPRAARLALFSLALRAVVLPAPSFRRALLWRVLAIAPPRACCPHAGMAFFPGFPGYRHVSVCVLCAA